MVVARQDLLRWVRRYEAAERRIRAERRAHPLTPDESLRLALSLAALDPGRADRERSADPSPEDLAAFTVWARLRNALRG